MSVHTKRKFVGNIKVDWEMVEIDKDKKYSKTPSEVDFEVYTKAYMQLEDKTIIQGFVYLNDDRRIIIPEPEPSILYFTNAESKLSEILKTQQIILNSDGFNNLDELSHVFFNFFQLSSDYIINLFTSIEAFNNYLIPVDFEMKIKRKFYNKERVQRLDFATKMKKIVPSIKNKSFVKDYAHKYEFILSIKSLRDNVVHIKNLSTGFPASYRDLYVSYLNFDFKKSYDYIKDYLNYYEENWIENCNCGI
jgi:hypothetical protein